MTHDPNARLTTSAPRACAISKECFVRDIKKVVMLKNFAPSTRSARSFDSVTPSPYTGATCRLIHRSPSSVYGNIHVIRIIGASRSPLSSSSAAFVVWDGDSITIRSGGLSCCGTGGGPTRYWSRPSPPCSASREVACFGRDWPTVIGTASLARPPWVWARGTCVGGGGQFRSSYLKIEVMFQNGSRFHDRHNSISRSQPYASPRPTHSSPHS